MTQRATTLGVLILVVAGTALAVQGGADVIRVHDVEENAKAVQVAEAARQPDD